VGLEGARFQLVWGAAAAWLAGVNWQGLCAFRRFGRLVVSRVPSDRAASVFLIGLRFPHFKGFFPEKSGVFPQVLQ
jgi:hypothetical protein